MQKRMFVAGQRGWLVRFAARHERLRSPTRRYYCTLQHPLFVSEILLAQIHSSFSPPGRKSVVTSVPSTAISIAPSFKPRRHSLSSRQSGGGSGGSGRHPPRRVAFGRTPAAAAAPPARPPPYSSASPPSSSGNAAGRRKKRAKGATVAVPQEKEKLNQYLATAIVGNDVLGSCLYAAGMVMVPAGRWAPLSFLLVGMLLLLYKYVMLVLFLNVVDLRSAPPLPPPPPRFCGNTPHAS